MCECDLAPLIAGLTTALGFIIAAAVAILVAAALNNNYWTAGGSPTQMVIAGGLALGAVGALVGADMLVDEYFQCMGAPDECDGIRQQLLTTLAALSITLGIQAAACFAVAASIAGIPWIGQAAMYPIQAALIVQAALIPYATALAVDLVNCAEAICAERAADDAAPVAVIAAGLTAVVATILLSRREKPKLGSGGGSV